MNGEPDGLAASPLVGMAEAKTHNQSHAQGSVRRVLSIFDCSNGSGQNVKMFGKKRSHNDIENIFQKALARAVRWVSFALPNDNGAWRVWR